MENRPYNVAIGRGDGLFAHTGDAVMYGAAPLLSALDASGTVRWPGRALAKALGTVALGPDSELFRRSASSCLPTTNCC